MVREIRARIGTARLLMDRLADDTTAHAEASRTQAIALIDALHRSKDLEASGKETLGELALEVPWALGDVTEVAYTFESGSGFKTRSQLQNVQHARNIFLNCEWNNIRSSGSAMAIRLDTIIVRCIALGCRCPNEFA